MKNNKIKTLLYLCLVGAAGSATSHPECHNPQVPVLKSVPKSQKPQGGDNNVVVFYVNGKEITTLHNPAGSIHGRLSAAGCGAHNGLAGFDAHASGNRAEIHVHLPHGHPYHEAFMVQLAHGVAFIWNKLRWNKPTMVQAPEVMGLFGANFVAENNVGIIHIHFDGLVGATGLSSGVHATPNSMIQLENAISVGDHSDTTTCPGGAVGALYSANFVAKNNVGTLHIHLPADIKAGLHRLFQMFNGLKELVPRMIPCSMQFCNKAHAHNGDSAGGPLTANVTARNANGVLHLDFDGLVGSAGFSGGCASNSMIKMENPMCQMGRVSVGAGCPSGGVFAANFAAHNNIGTIHLY